MGKKIKESFVKDILQQWHDEKISFSRMVELLNENPTERTSLTYEQKLMALSLKYYTNLKWEPIPGDFYTSCRNDLELYQVVDVTEDCIITRYCDPNKGLKTESWAKDEFFNGFGVYRVYVPECCFKASGGSAL